MLGILPGTQALMMRRTGLLLIARVACRNTIKLRLAAARQKLPVGETVLVAYHTTGKQWFNQGSVHLQELQMGRAGTQLS